MTYTIQDIEFIKSNWQTMTSYELAHHLGRRQGSISRKLSQLGLVTDKAKKIQESKRLRATGQQKCLTCMKVLPWTVEYFHRANDSFQSVCKACSTSRANDDYYQRHDTIEKAIHHKLLKAKRANRNRSFTYASADDILALWRSQRGLCFYTQEPMTHLAGQPNSFSMDRKDPSQGYDTNNIVLCCQIINYMKQSLSVSDFKLWASKVK